MTSTVGLVWPGMTFEEVVAYYRTWGETWSYMKNARVWQRSTIPNTDPTLHRQARSCWSGDEGSWVCPCGEDRVVEGKRCLTCGRPWWCER